MKKSRIWFLLVASILLISSCNLYRPFTSKKDVNDYLEEARRCLEDGDYACALENYNALPDGELKEQQLCLAYLSQGGMTLSDMVTVVNQSSDNMLGNLAQALVPWDETREGAMENAKTHCATYASATSSNAGPLMKALGAYADCAMRMAKTDEWVATSTDPNANCKATAGNRDGRVTKSDISDAANGNFTNTGMCASDVTVCADNIASINNGALAAAGLADFESAYDAIPDDLKAGIGGNGGRAALYDAALAD